MAFTGMDVPQVRELAATMKEKSGNIEDIITAVSAKLQGTDWKGPDREKFESEWNGKISGDLRNAAQVLQQASDDATRNAEEQETASAS